MAIPGNLLSTTTETIDPNTSGWSAVLNCAKSLGTGGRSGDGMLRITSTASGEMQARTVSSYPVVAGDTYFTFADAKSSTQAERIGIRWLTAASAEISITWSLTTATASSSWHRISVAGVAPATAARAQVVLSATAGASARVHDFENVYLGSPWRTTGNLFSFNVESGGELDASGWTAVTNATVGRLAPMVQWPVDWYYAGGHVITLTAVAGGNTDIEAVERQVAEPGRDYRAFAYLAPPTSVADCWVELRFYDSSDVLVGSERSYLDQPGTALYRQIVSGIAPATAATATLAAGIDSATGGQVVAIEGAVITLAPELVAGTVVPYEDGSFEQGVGAWTVTSGVATIGRSSPWSSTTTDGFYALAVSSATATTSVLRSGWYALGGDVGGQSWRPQVDALRTAGTWILDVGVNWYDDTDTLISSTGFSEPFNLPSDGSWWTVSNDFDAPVGAVSAEIEVQVDADAVSSTLRLDSAALRQVLPLAAAEPDDTLARIVLTLRELPVGSLITVWRVGPDGIRTLVRGEDGLIERQTITSDLMIVEDYEAPLGVPVSYRADLYDATTGAYAGTREDGPVTITAPANGAVWLKDPANPQRNMLVALVQRGPDWSRPIERAEYRIRGRRNTVILSDVRAGLSGDLLIWTQDDAEREALHLLLDSGNVLLWQTAPGYGVGQLYVAVGEAGEARVSGYGPEGWRAWSLPLTEVDMPTSGVNGSAGRTWTDVLAEDTDWDALRNRFATWEDVLLDQPAGG